MEIELFSEEERPVEQGFTVDSLEKAEWALSTKGRAQAEIDRFTAMANKLKADFAAKIDTRLAEIVKPHVQTCEVMTDFLRPWADVEIAKANGKRSVKLLSGTVGYRQNPARLEVTNEATAVAWLKEHHGENLIRVKEEVKKTETKKFIEAVGELPDGVELKAGEVRFYAEPLPEQIERK